MPKNLVMLLYSRLYNNLNLKQYGNVSIRRYIYGSKKFKGGTFWRQKRFQEKVAQCRKKPKRGPFTLIRFCRLRLKSKKPKGDPLEKKISKKRRTVPKNTERGDPLVLSSFVGYV